MEDEVFVMPEKYEGPVFIIHGRTDGEAKMFEGDKRLYRIPRSGILKTQFTLNYSPHWIEYYYEDSVGNRTTIPELWLPHATGDEKGTHVFAGETGNFATKEAGNGQSLVIAEGARGIITFLSFIVGDPNKADSLLNRRQQMFTQLQSMF